MKKSENNSSGAFPFEEDAKTNDGYVYTTHAGYSCAVANQHLTEVSMKWLETLPECRSVADLGCGDGAYTALLSQKMPHILFQGGDPAPSAVVIAQKNHPEVSFFVCDLLHKKSLTTHSSDAVILRGVIHHVSDAQEALRNAVQCGNNLLLIEPNGWNFLVKIIEKTSKYHRLHGEKSYTSSRLRNWITQAGGTVVREYYVGLVPFFCPKWAARLLQKVQPFIEKSFLAPLLCGQVVLEIRC